MGCTPSHSGIIHSIVKNTSIPLKKNGPIPTSSLDNNGFTNTLGKNDSNFYDADGELNSGISLENGQRISNLEKDGCKDRMDKNTLMLQEQWKKETVDEAMVKLSYQKGKTERTYARKQSSTGSEQDIGDEIVQESNRRKGKKSKSQRSHKQSRRVKSRDKDLLFPETEKKVDFPELLVKAHQNAYAYLNPNLSKYEAIISMANQASETQLIMQQMVSFMTLRFEEINQCLEEIAEDGEKLLKEVGNNLAWPLGKGNPTEQPDLLQQLLQYTVNKMQTINCTVSTLTSNTLQETCNYLQSASITLQEKFKVKQLYDERLLRTIKLLETSAVGPPQIYPNDVTLYSEDSGIGVDNESIKESRSISKHLRKRSDSESLGRNPEIISQHESITGNKMAELTDANLNKNESFNYSSKNKHTPLNVKKRSSIGDNISINSLGSSTTLEQDSINGQETEDTAGNDDSSDESEDNTSLSDQIRMPQRPMTSPAGTGTYKLSSKWLENPENEEMSLKMKEAISEKIKFVPEKLNNQMWIREEGETLALIRPSSASARRRKTSKHRRSRSVESLKSQAEDPTLLELQRTQKELTKKLEQLHLSNGNKNKEMQTNANIKSFNHRNDNIALSSSTNKLKACLDKCFNILPSQERVILTTSDQSIENNLDNNSCVVLDTFLQKQSAQTEQNVPSVERKPESMSMSPRQSVRKLIETFSPGDNSIKQRSLGPLRCIHKFGVPVLPPTISAYRGLQPLNHKHSLLPTNELPSDDLNTCLSKSFTSFPSDLYSDVIKSDPNDIGADDIENLPPPPLEILMDDSFNVLKSDYLKHHMYQSINLEPGAIKKKTTSQKMKGTITAIDLLPNKNGTDAYFSTEKAFKNQINSFPLRKCSLGAVQQLATQTEKDRGTEMQKRHEIEQAAHLYKQSHKIIPLQNPGELIKSSNDGEITDPCTNGPTLIKQKQCYSTIQKSVKTEPVVRRISPTRATAPSPPCEGKLTSPPVPRAIFKSHSHVQPSPPSLQNNISPVGSKMQSPPSQRKLPSPPSQRNVPSPPSPRMVSSPLSQRKVSSPPSQRNVSSPPAQQKVPSPPPQRKAPSPPLQRKLPSPPSQQKLSSPPQVRRQQSPPNQRRLPSPPSSRREPSPPSHCTPSPPLSPSFSQKGLRHSSDEQQSSSKMIGNAQSIFCPSSTSLFEAKLPSPPSTSKTEVASNQIKGPILRSSFSNHQYDDQHRRVAMSAANPQPFVRRCFSERRPRVQLRIPVSISAASTSEPDLQKLSAEDTMHKENEQQASQCLSELKPSNQTVTHPQLCIVGQGLQKE
ncbi:photoreceptor cilium actin regulator-like [Bombina bombina]|uniref:photoreceptor cilium actin regulator-like n=1 Tax=Bombina bombina TaxID=8345 RepID=UPI00235B074A|nr:photoreceptor cilium actin regulator-like [Bombina bombina]